MEQHTDIPANASTYKAPSIPERDLHDFDAYGDRIVLPTFEQVAKSMARALRCKDDYPALAERDRQASEGRLMAASEGFGAKSKPIDERQAQIRAGQSASAREANQACPPRQNAQQAPRQAPAPQDPNAAPKKRRNRNRNKFRSGGEGGRPAPRPAM